MQQFRRYADLKICRDRIPLPVAAYIPSSHGEIYGAVVSGPLSRSRHDQRTRVGEGVKWANSIKQTTIGRSVCNKKEKKYFSKKKEFRK